MGGGGVKATGPVCSTARTCLPAGGVRARGGHLCSRPAASAPAVRGVAWLAAGRAGGSGTRRAAWQSQPHPACSAAVKEASHERAGGGALARCEWDQRDERVGRSCGLGAQGHACSAVAARMPRAGTGEWGKGCLGAVQPVRRQPGVQLVGDHATPTPLQRGQYTRGMKRHEMAGFDTRRCALQIKSLAPSVQRQTQITGRERRATASVHLLSSQELQWR